MLRPFLVGSIAKSSPGVEEGEGAVIELCRLSDVTGQSCCRRTGALSA